MNKNKKYKCRLFLLLIPLVLAAVIVSPDSVFAGGINGNESSIISAARGTFQYEGKLYVAKQEHIQSLISKLSEDDIDLTAEQAEELISEMYGNIKTGVDEGYLVEINDNKNNGSGNSGNGTDKKDSTQGKDGLGNQDAKTNNVTYDLPPVIKDTGYSYFTMNTFIVFLILSIVFLIGIIMSVKICKRGVMGNNVFKGNTSVSKREMEKHE